MIKLFKIIKESYHGFKGPNKMANDNLNNFKKQGINDNNIGNNINGLGNDMKLNDFVSFQKRILGVLKYLFFYPLMRIGYWVGGRFIVRKVPDGCAFRNFKAWDESVNKALIVWHDVYQQDLSWKNPVKRLKLFIKSRPYQLLKMIHEIEMTLLLSDSAYFEYKNIQLMELYNEMRKLHGDDPCHILYKNKDVVNDPAYFAAVNEGSYVVLKGRLQTLRPYYDKKGNLKVKYLGGSKTYTINTLANELNCVPKKDVMLKQIRSLKQELAVKEHFLININKNSVEALNIHDETTQASN